MQTIEQSICGKRFFRKKIKNKTYKNILFDTISFKYVDFIDCKFIKCKFKNCYIGLNTTYKNCSWKDTKFTGKYSGFSDGRFSQCLFENVTIQSGLMQNIYFTDCKFSGKLKNLIFIGEIDDNDWTTRFTNCDLSGVILDNVSFVSGVDLSTTALPKSGARIFDNTNGKFTDALGKAIAELDEINASPLEILSDKDQAIEVYDQSTLSYLFTDAPEGLEQFEKIAKNYEITEQKTNCPD